MKKWDSPKMTDLKLSQTCTDEMCPYSSEVKNNATTKTLLPVFVWGDGKVGCTYWNGSKHGCEHPKYGSPCGWWPCPPITKDGSQ